MHVQRTKEAAIAANHYHTIKVEDGNRGRLTLPDGSAVVLNGGSELSVPDQFATNSREIRLVAGEVYLDVVRDPARPFVVHSANLDIQVLGTSFSVRDYPDERNATNGIVHLLQAGVAASGHPVVYTIADASIATVDGAMADSYDITYQAGTLTVGPPPAPVVTADGLNALIVGGTLEARVSVVKATDAMLQLVDVSGHILLSQKVTLAAGVNTYELPVFNLSHGAYIVIVRGSGMKLTDKIIY